MSNHLKNKIFGGRAVFWRQHDRPKNEWHPSLRLALNWNPLGVAQHFDMQVKLFLLVAVTLLSAIGATEQKPLKTRKDPGLRGVPTSTSKTSKTSEGKSKKSSKSTRMKKATTRDSQKMSKQRKESKSRGGSSSYIVTPVPAAEEDDTEDDEPSEPVAPTEKDDTEGDKPSDPGEDENPACGEDDPECDGNRRRTAVGGQE
jgi:hypothetical protein